MWRQKKKNSSIFFMAETMGNPPLKDHDLSACFPFIFSSPFFQHSLPTQNTSNEPSLPLLASLYFV